ncbi:saccharopine dehydrogenase [Mycobacterium sp. 852002-51163_SCH5372311]|uniref:saccharopine dehydrogenase family protein n=1 Tax=Mycobacterium sp. 852002-51163_SCH5372311 TaxID=1834097 RepID=UPI0007FD24FA|nr:saccharopine dehydrogenase NADP-binding domain-containing protein [Mycobacterium sp. 852002-51163_SCH5372311]OBF86072.1 saccharopine dehydrogenase [Mycobacterium sp. 852002-51163_SCH5372311]
MSNNQTTAKRIVFIGAAGDMCRVAIDRFAKTAGDQDWKLELYDIRPESLDALVASLPAGSATAGSFDLFDAAALRNAIDGAALVVLGAGPYNRTAEPVMEACIEKKVPYLDLDDDEASTRAALTLDAQAKAAGVPILIGCGASPGFTNVMAADAARDMDTVERIDVCWVTGDEGPVPFGRAVLDHAIRGFAGPCQTWEHGRSVTHQTFLETDVFALGNTLGDNYRLYECAHPEPVTMPRRWPGADRIRVLGALDPPPTNGIMRGVAVAVQEGQISMDEAIDFINDLLTDKTGSLKVWRHALSGLWGTIRRGEISAAEVLKFLAMSAARKHPPFRGTNYVRVTGKRDGMQVVSVRRAPVSGPGTAWTTMASLTGSATAAFMVLAIGELGAQSGVLAPEDWANPENFYTALAAAGGSPLNEVVEAVVTPSTAVTTQRASSLSS